MAEIYDSLMKKGVKPDLVAPLFVSCDPKRDSIDSIREYVKGSIP
jgi:cytochrome oxidase Cu insertion factor (SCO1/SenC/PrrC family)